MKIFFKRIAKQFAKGNELRYVWMNVIFQTLFAYSGVKYWGLGFDHIFVVIFFLPITCGLCWFMGKVIEDY